jgi:hypothetical protein
LIAGFYDQGREFSGKSASAAGHRFVKVAVPGVKKARKVMVGSV